MDLFTGSEENSIIAESLGESIFSRATARKKHRQAIKDTKFEELIMECGGLPSREESLRIKTTGTSDTGNIFSFIINQMKTVEELYVSTWIISRENIDLITKEIDSGKIKNMTFIVSKRLRELKKSVYAYFVEEMLKRSEIVKFKVVNCHAKTFSISDGINHYTVDGSGNWTSNPRIENYTIVNDIDALNFNKQWMTELA